MLINKIELAKVLRCSVPTLNAMIGRHRDFPIVSQGRRGVDWRFDPHAVLAFVAARREAEELAARQQQERVGQLGLDLVPGEVEAPPLLPSHQLALAKAKREQRRLDTEGTLLVEVARVREVLGEVLPMLATMMGELPGAIGGLEGVPPELVDALRGRVETHLREMGDKLSAKLSMSGPDPGSTRTPCGSLKGVAV